MRPAQAFQVNVCMFLARAQCKKKRRKTSPNVIAPEDVVAQHQREENARDLQVWDAQRAQSLCRDREADRRDSQ